MDIQKFINQDLGVEMRSYIENNNVYLNAEDVCRGLGFVDKERERASTATNGGTKLFIRILNILMFFCIK